MVVPEVLRKLRHLLLDVLGFYHHLRFGLEKAEVLVFVVGQVDSVIDVSFAFHAAGDGDTGRLRRGTAYTKVYRKIRFCKL